jgi:aspartate-semialdehyde dehydrogenase
MKKTKIPVGILGATGMVGQRFITILSNHPLFEVKILAASPRSAGKRYEDAVKDRWSMEDPIPENIRDMTLLAVEEDMDKIIPQARLVFSAIDLDKDSIRRIEESYASGGIAVVSNNSAHRWTEDIPMILPEINPGHLNLIDIQRKNRGWSTGLIVVKPNCSIQSYVPLLTPLMEFEPSEVTVTTLQAVSGAGKTIESWPEMKDNVNPLIPGEEEKSEKEPLRIWGEIRNGKIETKTGIGISATCIRVPISDGHMASVSVKFNKKPTKEQIIEAWRNFSPLANENLPSAPNPFITYFEDEDRPQTALDRNLGGGMGIAAGRLREDNVLDYKFIGLSHNTIRGAAGGSILTAELLVRKGCIKL